EAVVEAAVPGQPAVEQGLPAQGVVRPALGLQPARLGAAILRELEGRLEMATAGALPEVRPDGRGALGWDRGVLPWGEQGGPGLRRGAQQQDPEHSTTGLRLPRR